MGVEAFVPVDADGCAAVVGADTELEAFVFFVAKLELGEVVDGVRFNDFDKFELLAVANQVAELAGDLGAYGVWLAVWVVQNTDIDQPLVGTASEAVLLCDLGGDQGAE